MGNPKLTGTLPPAAWRVKLHLPGPEGEACQAGQTGPSPSAIRAPAFRQAIRMGDGKVLEEGFLGRLARLVSRGDIGRASRRAKVGCCGGEVEMIEASSRASRLSSTKSQPTGSSPAAGDGPRMTGR